ncbi:MAG: prolyl oligopeptidase family serine peptidase [Fimbriimonadaceae bacterium]|nr:prolyl oligopeptidase family serine peptidase [Fimbriimonadaceae bacterium]
MISVLIATLTLAQAPAADFAQGLAVSGVARSARFAFQTDAVQPIIASGTWTEPKLDAEVAMPAGSPRKWTELKAKENGAFDQRPFSGGYAYFSVHRDVDSVEILEAAGHGMVYVNGEPRMGDVYGTGYVKLPVALHKGENSFMFSSGRGELRAKLTKPSSAAVFNLADATVPDLVTAPLPPKSDGPIFSNGGAALPNRKVGVIVVNASNEPLAGLKVRLAFPGKAFIETELPNLPPCSTNKIPVEFENPRIETAGSVEATLTLIGPAGMLDFQKLTFRVREPNQTRKVTFLSLIDVSVQYFALNPAQTPGKDKALVLTLHGAGVEAIGQADAYKGKDWANIVAPTNRRPFGFDWEDWGRKDMAEVLGLATTMLSADPQQIYLTGHSMGGHGTWQNGVTYPGEFAAIAPSAGWSSFFSYTGAPRQSPDDPVDEMFARAQNPSDTVALKENFRNLDLFILHGDADDNVPVREARNMKAELEKMNKTFEYHEQPGAGHWWGNECVDWPPIFEMFQKTRRPKPSELMKVDFSTFNPSISSKYYWVTIERQESSMNLSSVKLERQASKMVGTTANVAMLTIDPVAIDKSLNPYIIEIDGSTVSLPTPGLGNDPIALERVDKQWRLARTSTELSKSSMRSGPFKEAFNHGMIFVYGTKGDDAENAWSFAKARFDAEQWWYRGNGYVPLMSDDEFNRSDIRHFENRSVIVFGNADTNSVWNRFLSDSPIQVRRNRLTVGKKQLKGSGYATLFARPRSGSTVAMIGAVGGTGVEGMRSTDRLPYFVSGTGYPDWCVFTKDVWSKGLAGVLGSGYFDNDWRLTMRQTAWRAE